MAQQLPVCDNEGDWFSEQHASLCLYVYGAYVGAMLQ